MLSEIHQRPAQDITGLGTAILKSVCKGGLSRRHLSKDLTKKVECGVWQQEKLIPESNTKIKTPG